MFHVITELLILMIAAALLSLFASRGTRSGHIPAEADSRLGVARV
jgi:hypothetical protein